MLVMCIMKRDVKTLIELICDEQTRMIRKDSLSYDTYRYRYLENLKVRLKSLKDVMENQYE